MTICDLCGSSVKVYRYGIKVESHNADDFYRNGEYCHECHERILKTIEAVLATKPATPSRAKGKT